MRLFNSLLVMLFMTMLFYTHAGEGAINTLPELAKKVRPSVYMIIASDKNGREISTGTGFMISAEGKMITNHHVIEKGATFKVKSSNGGVFNVQRVASTDAKNDLALLIVECKEVQFLKLGESLKLEAGVRLAVVGSPLGLEGSLSEGIVSAIRTENQQRWIQMTAAISPGSSGSPVLNESGDVIGVAAATIVKGQSLNLAIPVEFVSQLIQAPENGVGQANAPAGNAVAVTGAKLCEVCGAGRGKIGVASGRDEINRENTMKWHYICDHCDDGRALAKECYHLLLRVIENNKKLMGETDARITALESRMRDVEARRKSLKSDVSTFKESKSDVRDALAKTETRLREVEKEYEKLNKDITETKLNRAGSEREVEIFFNYWVEYLKREMVAMGVAIPEKIEAGPLPPFTLGRSYGTHYWYYGFSLNDLIVSARFNLDTKTKVAAKGNDPRPKKQVRLKNGSQIVSKMIVEDGENYVIRGEDGKMQTIPKKDVDAIFDE